MENEKLAGLIQDLTAINQERARAYEEASMHNHIFDVSLRGTFALLANQSRQNTFILKQQLEKLHAKKTPVVNGHGELYKQWKNLPITFAGADKKSMLQSCEAGEEAMQVVYKMALEQPVNSETRQLLQNQQKGLQGSQTVIQQLLKEGHGVKRSEW
jgi:uncharacterized protein (TIGR02284 family)